MKKSLITLCSLMLLGLASCSDSPQGKPVPEPLPEGAYSPERRISNILNDGGDSEIWLWDDTCLVALADENQCGGYEEKCWFEYDGARLSSMRSSLQGLPYDATYRYSGKELTHINVASGEVDIMGLAFSHGADGNISSVQVDVVPEMSDYLLTLIGGVFDGEMAAQVDIQDIRAATDFEWKDGDIVRQRLNADIDAVVTMGLVKEMADLESVLGSFSWMADLIPDTTQLPLHIVMSDTIDYSYDGHPNPVFGLLYAPDVSVLCAHNVATLSSHGSATFNMTMQTPMGSIPFSIPYAVPARTAVFDYEYDESGYPVDVWQDGNHTKSYIYQL